MSDLNVIIATDCGSTTTKAILIEKKGDEYRQTYRGEAPTTVEAPHNDVTRGVLNSIAEIEDLSGRQILDGERIITPAEGNRGVDIYISTSSAGGGLQMLVAGAVKTMTAESAQRAALGAGAIVMDVLASNDKRLPHEKISLIRGLRPDMILLSGGTDGGTVSHVVELAEFIAAADPKPRLGHTFRLPVIFAGNKNARPEIEKALGEKTDLAITENIRPTLEEENLFPARMKIQDLFMEHVMAQAPGYGRLKSWTAVPIMPTPAAVGNIIRTVSEQEGISVLGVDIGGATTDVFSVFDTVFNRTVSANLGMSYSVSNVLAEAGLANVLRWVPFDMDDEDLRNRIKNKMIRPTTIPQTRQELIIEQALCREALRLAFIQHKLLAVGLKGVQQERTISDLLEQSEAGATLVNMMSLSLIVGSGGVLSHAPRRRQSMMMMIDAFQPEGVTRMAVDSIFMMPHLGVLAEVNKQAATEVFEKDCLISLGTCVAPVGKPRNERSCLQYTLTVGSEQRASGSLDFGNVLMIPLALGEVGQLDLSPSRGLDMGEGSGKHVQVQVTGGAVGLVLDVRGRPIIHARSADGQRELVQRWAEAFGAYAE